MEIANQLRPAGIDKSVKARCRLLELPAEVRNRIFELALAEDAYHEIDLWPPYIAHDRDLPAVTRTNRQIRKETLPVFTQQALICVFAVAKHKWQQSRQWLKEQTHAVPEVSIREVKMIFTKYGGDILTIYGFLGRRPSYSLTHIANTRRMGDHTYEEDELRTFVETKIEHLIKESEGSFFGLDEYSRFADAFVEEYYDF